MSGTGALILYASQTGTAEEIAKQIYERGKSEYSLKLEVKEMDSFATKLVARFSKPSVVVFVLSSTGEGDPPDNGTRFFGRIRRLLKAQQPKDHSSPFCDCMFTILGIGDSNYTFYQGAPKTLSNAFHDLGAKYFYPRGVVDEVKGLEEQVEKWIDHLWEPLKATLIPPEPEPVRKSPRNLVESVRKKLHPNLPHEESTPPSPPKELETSDDFTLREPRMRVRPKIVRKSMPSVPPPRFYFKPVSTGKDVSIGKCCGPKRSDNVYNLFLMGARWLTSVDSVKQTIEFTFVLPPEFPSYLPGDSIGFYCPNPEDLVAGVMKRLCIESFGLVTADAVDESTFPSHLKNFFPSTIAQVLRWACDLTSLPTKRFLRMLAEYCTDNDDKERLLHLCSIKGKELYRDIIQEERLNLAELLDLFPSCSPPASHVISLLPAMTPRYYSFACAPIDGREKQVKFALSLATSSTPSGKIRRGICTHFLCNLAICAGLLDPTDRYIFPESESAILKANEPPSLYGFYNKSSFHLPEQSELVRPRIMIGPGTGVAPFIGFLEYLQNHNEEVGENWLFFGCRKEKHDHLYRDELEGFIESCGLNLVTAFSRETSDVVYVQHKLLERSEEIGKLILEKECFIYICGDAAGMSKDVTAALTTIIQTSSESTPEEASVVIADLIRGGRLLYDVWA